MSASTDCPNGFTIVPLHATYGAEVQGVDFSRPITSDEAKELRALGDNYGVLVFRNTGLTDEAHIEFSRYFGELDDTTPYLKAGRKSRLPYPELFDAGNVNADTGGVAALTEAQVIGNKANELFHVDSSFNARRAGYSLLLAHVLPPPGTGGATEFADSRSAYDDLDADTKAHLDGLVASHSLFHSRKTAMPEFFKDMDVTALPMSKHKMVQTHEGSGRTNLYIASYCHHVEGMPVEDGQALLKRLIAHVSQPKYVLRVEWLAKGDLICWDNTSVMHRATGGSYEGKHVRDMRRTTVKDMSSTRFGENAPGEEWRVGLP